MPDLEESEFPPEVEEAVELAVVEDSKVEIEVNSQSVLVRTGSVTFAMQLGNLRALCNLTICPGVRVCRPTERNEHPFHGCCLLNDGIVHAIWCLAA